METEANIFCLQMNNDSFGYSSTQADHKSSHFSSEQTQGKVLLHDHFIMICPVLLVGIIMCE